MVIYGMKFVYNKSEPTEGQQRVAAARAAAARRGRQQARRFAARRQEAAKEWPEGPPEELVTVDIPDDGCYLAGDEETLQLVGDKAAQREEVAVVEEVKATKPEGVEEARQPAAITTHHFSLLEHNEHCQAKAEESLPNQHLQQDTFRQLQDEGEQLEANTTLWPLLPLVTPALRVTTPPTHCWSQALRGVLVPRLHGPRVLWRQEGATQYLGRSFSLLRFYDFATRRRQTAASRGAGQQAQLLATYDRLLHPDARPDAAELVINVLHGLPFLCSAVFPAGRSLHQWAADCTALIPRRGLHQ